MNSSSQIEFMPRYLSSDEIRNPDKVIREFFEYVSLPSARNHLWDWIKMTTCGSFDKESKRDKTNLLEFYEASQRLIEACHIIHQRKSGLGNRKK